MRALKPKCLILPITFPFSFSQRRELGRRTGDEGLMRRCVGPWPEDASGQGPERMGHVGAMFCSPRRVSEGGRDVEKRGAAGSGRSARVAVASAAVLAGPVVAGVYLPEPPDRGGSCRWTMAPGRGADAPKRTS